MESRVDKVQAARMNEIETCLQGEVTKLRLTFQVYPD